MTDIDTGMELTGKIFLGPSPHDILNIRCLDEENDDHQDDDKR